MSHQSLSIVSQLPARRGVLVVDTEKRVIFADEVTAELLGIPQDEIVGRSCSEFSSSLPCANGTCTLDTPCHVLHEGKTGEVLFRSNEHCTFETKIAAKHDGTRLGTIHVVTLANPPKTSPSATAAGEQNFHGIIGSHPRMQKLFELVALVAGTDVTVHIFGPSGSGKELVAEAIHRLSGSAEKRLVKLN